MSTIRVKVQVGDDKKGNYQQKTNAFRKFVYVIESPSNKTINELIRILQEYIIQKFSFTKTEIVDLMTDDGFILSKSDLCSNVLKDNDHIICIDMQRFIEEYNLKFKDDIIWLDLKQHDASDNREKFIRIGLNNFSELFIRMNGIAGVLGLYVFGIYELMKIANEKPKDNLIARLDSTNDYDQKSDEPYSNKLHIRLDHSRMRIEKGDITCLLGDLNDGATLTDRQRQRLKELTSKLPPPKRTGPQINLKTYENLKLTRHECEGESSIRMAYGNTNIVTAYQDSRSSEEDTFCQHFVITHIIFSKKPLILPKILQQKRSAPIDKPASVASLNVFYQAHDESWRECQNVAIAPIAIRNEEPKWLIDSVINIEPDRLISFVIKGWIPVKGEAGRDNAARSRVHKNLPQPLKLKIVTTDNFGKQCSLVVEQLNTPLELPTRESYVKNNQSSINEFLAFVYTDDCENDVRVYMVMYLDQENGLRIENSIGSSCAYERKAFSTMEYNARKNKTSEVPLDDTHRKYYTNETIAIALFDPETYMLYAIRLEISTKTSKTEETVLIPIEKIKQ